MDVRLLQTQWTDASGFSQRAPDHQHIAEMVDNFAVSIRRTHVGSRLFVSMTQSDFDASVKATAARLGQDYSAYRIQIQDDARAATYDLPDDVPALFQANVATANFQTYNPVPCLVHAGQHRVLALRQFAETHHPEKMNLSLQGLVDPDERVRNDVRQVRKLGRT